MNETVSYREMVDVGITYRQVDYWTNRGYLRAVNAAPGYGAKRRWPGAERDIAQLMIRFIAAGLSVEAAAKAAREAIETGQNSARLAAGFTITWEAAA